MASFMMLPDELKLQVVSFIEIDMENTLVKLRQVNPWFRESIKKDTIYEKLLIAEEKILFVAQDPEVVECSKHSQDGQNSKDIRSLADLTVAIELATAEVRGRLDTKEGSESRDATIVTDEMQSNAHLAQMAPFRHKYHFDESNPSNSNCGLLKSRSHIKSEANLVQKAHFRTSEKSHLDESRLLKFGNLLQEENSRSEVNNSPKSQNAARIFNSSDGVSLREGIDINTGTPHGGTVLDQHMQQNHFAEIDS
ncbi:MAG: hypothetical protein Q9186_006253 [Xanthomendoza sp. 1 TL-2023]